MKEGGYMEDIRYYVSIKFESNNKAYTFYCDNLDIKEGDLVVVETQYGIEMGEAVSNPTSDRKLPENIEVKPIVRKATEEDILQYKRNLADAKAALLFCQDEADVLKLGMNVLKAEYTLDRSKITFIYVAEERVDFRELLKILAARFHCRIELRQIGARDKAKIIGGIGSCGRELCCRKFKSEFDMVSINMAKNQLLALNIQKLSGHCGKLMCCLKYEDDTYKKLREGLPKLNAQVEYEDQKYRITSMNVITRTCKLENKENALFITLDDLLAKGKFKVNKKVENNDAKAKEL